MADSYVVTGAMMACTFGMAPSSLVVLPVRTILLSNVPRGNIMDFAPMVNIMPFGMCTTPSNPTVAAATAAAMGALTPMPCIPAVTTPWMPGKPTVLIQGQPALTRSCRNMCMWGGQISFITDGQMPGIPPMFVPPVSVMMPEPLTDIVKNFLTSDEQEAYKKEWERTKHVGAGDRAAADRLNEMANHFEQTGDYDKAKQAHETAAQFRERADKKQAAAMEAVNNKYRVAGGQTERVEEKPMTTEKQQGIHNQDTNERATLAVDPKSTVDPNSNARPPSSADSSSNAATLAVDPKSTVDSNQTYDSNARPPSSADSSSNAATLAVDSKSTVDPNSNARPPIPRVETIKYANYKDFVEANRANREAWEATLTQKEIKLIEGYISENHFLPGNYSAVNGLMRGDLIDLKKQTITFRKAGYPETIHLSEFEEQLKAATGETVPEYIARVSKDAEDLNTAISRSTLGVDTTLYRGVGTGTLKRNFGIDTDTDSLDDIIAKINNKGGLEDAGFMSSTPSPTGGFTGKDVVFIMDCDADTRVGDFNRWNSKEQEILLAKGQKFEAVGAQYVPILLSTKDGEPYSKTQLQIHLKRKK